MEIDLPVPFARRLSARQLVALDVLVAAALAASSAGIVARGLYTTATTAETMPPGRHGVTFAVACFLTVGIVCLAVPARRRHPKAVWGVTVAGAAILLGLGVRVPAEMAGGLAIYSVSAAAAAWFRGAMVAGAIALLMGSSAASWQVWTLETDAIMFGAILIGWLAGENTRARQIYVVALAEQAAERERARARHAAMEERARIARDLHDGLAHAMSVIAVRSGVARVIMASQPGQGAESLKIIENVSRQSLRELRRIVTVLRQPEESWGKQLDPAPSLADLPDLVNQITAAGVHVNLRIEGETRNLPLTEDLSAYRIAQEALTNIVRHSGAAKADLFVRYEPDAVEIECSDPGGDRPHPQHAEHTNGGHGIVGMRERVALCGGQFAAGPAGQGFRVLARLPIAEEVA